MKAVTLDIPEGCIYGFVGSNGAGKSTLLRVISGIYRPDSGSVTIDKTEVYDGRG
ncbi:MAG: ATP-binding cassette domain-containing protein [Ruminococcus bicirculans (ex Wegman et al. 2014)]